MLYIVIYEHLCLNMSNPSVRAPGPALAPRRTKAAESGPGWLQEEREEIQ